jgi:hypothetical protein
MLIIVQALGTFRFVLIALGPWKIIRSHVTASALGRPVIRIDETPAAAQVERSDSADGVSDGH